VNIALICTDSDVWAFGTRMMSAVLKRAGHSTRLVLLPSEEAEYAPGVMAEARELVRDADLIGLSCYSRGSRKAHQMAAALRELGRPLIWGGLHASLNPAECAESATMVCRGEGEETILELVEALGSGHGWEQVRNLAYRRQGELVLNPLRPPVANLDDLPLGDFERTNEFHLTRGHVTRVSEDAHRQQERRLQYIGSRGCAFRCTYCCNRKINELYAGNGRYLRRMSPANYVAQLSTLYHRYFPNATDVFVLDEDFFLRTVPEIEQFAALYREQVGLPLDCMASAPRITEEKLRPLVDAGLWRISLGVESGSERTKKEVFERPISNERVVRASEAIQRHPSVAPCYFFIIGNPYEHRDDLLDTLNLMLRMAYPYYINMYNLVFFPGSDLYDRAVHDGIIAGTRDSGYELHFRAGLKFSSHAWKRRNLYLNGLLFLTEGKVTRHRIGLLPRRLIPLLTRPAVIDWMDRRTALCSLVIGAKVLLLRTRSLVGGVLKKVIGNPANAYNLPRYFKNTLARHLHIGTAK